MRLKTNAKKRPSSRTGAKSRPAWGRKEKESAFEEQARMLSRVNRPAVAMWLYKNSHRLGQEVQQLIAEAKPKIIDSGQGHFQGKPFGNLSRLIK